MSKCICFFIIGRVTGLAYIFAYKSSIKIVTANKIFFFAWFPLDLLFALTQGELLHIFNKSCQPLNNNIKKNNSRFYIFTVIT